MNTTDREFTIVSTKLADGRRALRFVDEATGLVLERILDPQASVWQQKERLRRAFEAALARELETVPVVAA